MRTILKKVCAISIALTMVISFMPFEKYTSYAETADDFEYYVTENDKVCITKYTGNNASVIVPATIDGKEVTTIEDGAFENNTSVEEIHIVNGISSIFNHAFSGCINLMTIALPSSVTAIGDSAFENCSSLATVEIPDGVFSIGARTFYGCSNLTTIEIPNRVTSIETMAFSGCSKLTTIEIPDGVPSIGYRVFYGCSNLEKIDLPNSVTSIGNGSFEGCSSLTTIKIPDGVPSIEYRAFSGCSNLTKIDLPNSVKSIGNYAFYDCSSLTTIEIPEGVPSIGYETFSGCSSLTTIKIPDSVYLIDDMAFSGCSQLSSIKIPDEVTSIGYSAFSGCSNLTTIKIPESVTLLEGAVFGGCSSLSEIIIPNSVKSIGPMAFGNCISLTTIEIPKSVLEIGSGVFYGCNNLEAVHYLNPDMVGAEPEWHNYQINCCAICGNYHEHDYDTGVITKEPTCTKSGVKEFTCIICGDVNKETINSIGHDYIDEWIVDIEPTCNGEGVKSHHCTRCTSKTDVTIIDKLNHKEIVTKEAKAATCTEAGWTKEISCERCKDILTESKALPAKGHTEIKHDEKAATCVEAGWYAYVTCKDCDYTTYKEIPAIKTHSYDNYIFDKDKYMETISKAMCICSSCGNEISQNIGFNDIDHETVDLSIVGDGVLRNGLFTISGLKNISNVKYGRSESVVIKDVLIDLLGLAIDADTVTFKCTDEYAEVFSVEELLSSDKDGNLPILAWTRGGKPCDLMLVIGEQEDGKSHSIKHVNRIEVTAAHKWDTGQITTAPTCVEAGVKTYICQKDNNHIKTETIPATGKHSYCDWIVTKAATCTTEGVETRACACGKEEIRTIEKLGHNMVEGPAVAPTCEKTGLTAGQFCTRCPYEIAQEIVAATGHNYKSVVTLPTCESEGYTTYTCKCGHTYTADKTAAQGHKYGAWNITTAATCTTEGVETRMCACGKEEIRTIEKLGHNMVERPAVAPTCEKTGLTAGQFCTRCSHEIAQEIVAATNHSYGKWTVIRSAEVGKPGLERKLCLNGCGNYLDERDITIVSTGTCGPTSRWSLDVSGVMTISGSGCVSNERSEAFMVAKSKATKLVFEEGITEIEASFENAYNLTSIEFADSIEVIGKMVFYKLWKLDCMIDLPENLKHIGNDAFGDTRVKVDFMTAPNLESIGGGAFNYCSSMSGDIELPGSVISIDGGAFYNTNINHAIINNPNCEIGVQAFHESAYLVGAAGSTVEKYGGLFKYLCEYYDANHNCQFVVTKYAKIGVEGQIANKCIICGDVQETTTIAAVAKPAVAAKTFTGKALTQTIKIKDTKGNVITTVRVTGKNVGTFKKTVKLTGDYTGNVTASFKINPKGTILGKLTAAKKALTVKWNKPKATFLKQTTGYEIRYSTKSGMGGAKTKVVKKSGTTSLKLTGLKAKTKYYVQIRTYKTVNGTKYYSAWSAKKSMKTK